MINEELKDDYYSDIEFINQKLEKIYEKGIVLLKPMNIERRTKE